MSQPARASVAAVVNVPVSADRAFAALVDAEGQGDWMFATTVYPVEGDAASPAVGARLVAFTGFLGIGVLDVMKVTELHDGVRWVVAHEGSIIRGSGTFSVRPLGADAAEVRLAEEWELPFGLLGRLGWLIVRPAVGWGIRHSLRRLAAQLASR